MLRKIVKLAAVGVIVGITGVAKTQYILDLSVATPR